MFKAEVQVFGEQGWHTNGLEFPSAEAAAVYVDDLFCRWTMTTDWRVIEVFPNGNTVVVITMRERMAL